MPRLTFLPSQKFTEVEPQTKILLGGRKAGVDIRFGCAACRCGMCGVRIVAGQETLSPMKSTEVELLRRLKLTTDGSVRLACQARLDGDCTVDLDFQDTYNPDDSFDDDED